MSFYARIRFAVNLLPLLQKAQGLRRVVTVFAGTKEGKVDTADFQARHVPLLSQRGHLTSMMTLALEAMAETAPDVSPERFQCGSLPRVQPGIGYRRRRQPALGDERSETIAGIADIAHRTCNSNRCRCSR